MDSRSPAEDAANPPRRFSLAECEQSLRDNPIGCARLFGIALGYRKASRPRSRHKPQPRLKPTAPTTVVKPVPLAVVLH